MPAPNNPDEDRLEIMDDLVEVGGSTSPRPNPARPQSPQPSRPQPQAPAAWTLEPELQKPLPRPVRESEKHRNPRVWVIGLLVVISGSALFSLWYLSGQRSELSEQGVEVEGTLEDIQGLKLRRSRNAKGTYSYTVRNKQYRMTTDLSEEEYQAAREGDTRVLVYLPDAPDVVETRDALDRPGGYSKLTLVLWGVAAFASVALLAFWIYYELRRMRISRLLSHGTATPTSSLRVVKLSKEIKGEPPSEGATLYNVDYTFEHDGNEYSGREVHTFSDALPFAGPGARTTVLFDPTDPSRHLLYRSTDNFMEIGRSL